MLTRLASKAGQILALQLASPSCLCLSPSQVAQGIPAFPVFVPLFIGTQLRLYTTLRKHGKTGLVDSTDKHSLKYTSQYL